MRKLDFPVDQGMEKSGLRHIIMLKAENAGVEYNGRFYTFGQRLNRMQIAGVNEKETLLVNEVGFHIYIYLVITLHKINDFHLIMPVVLGA